MLFKNIQVGKTYKNSLDLSYHVKDKGKDYAFTVTEHGHPILFSGVGDATEFHWTEVKPKLKKWVFLLYGKYSKGWLTCCFDSRSAASKVYDRYKKGGHVVSDIVEVCFDEPSSSVEVSPGG